MADTDGLIAFIEKCLADDESDALDAKRDRSGAWTYTETRGGDYKVIDDLGYSVTGHYDVESAPWWTGPHVARWDPARVLAEIAAKREIVKDWQIVTASNTAERNEVNAAVYGLIAKSLEMVLRRLAAPYAGRPGWKDEWAVA